MTTPHHDCGCDHSHPQSKYEQALSHYDLHLHDEQVAVAVRRLLDEHKAEYDTDEVKRQLIGTLELTSLKVTDSAESILALTERINDFADVTIWAYDCSTLLGSVSGTASGQFTLSFSASNITSVAVRPGSYIDYVAVDNISFAPVPEPATYATMALGLAGLLAWRRRQQR